MVAIRGVDGDAPGFGGISFDARDGARKDPRMASFDEVSFARLKYNAFRHLFPYGVEECADNASLWVHRPCASDQMELPVDII
jgi:hypothetical protein